MSEQDLILQIDILDDGEVVESIELDEDKIKVGKLATSQLHLDDPNVSRIHAVLENQGDGTYQAIDLGSASGTYVNGEKISKSIVGDGDEMRFGETVVRLQVFDPNERQQAEQAQAAVAPGEIPEGHIELEDGTVVEPFTLQGYYDDAGNYIPGYYDGDGAYHYGYGHYDDQGTWQVAHGYYDPDGEWIPTEAPEGKRVSDTELYTANFFEDSDEGTTLEIAHLWNDQVLGVETLKKPRTLTAGGHEGNDYVLEERFFDIEKFPLIVFDPEDGYRLNFTAHMNGKIRRRGEELSLQEAVNRGVAGASNDVKGAKSLALTREVSVRLDFGGNTFLIHFAKLPALAGGAFGVDRTPFLYQSISLAIHVAFMMLVFMLPDGFGQFEYHDHDAHDRFAELAQPPEEEEEEELDEDMFEDEDDDEEESEAEAADEDEVEDVEEIEIEGQEDMDEEELQEARDREVARDAGALAAFSGDPQDAIGGDTDTLLADMDADHSASGVGGLGLAGGGRGGAEGQEGVGMADVGTTGGAGAGSTEADLGEAETVDPEVVPEEPETTGALDREIIQRVVRQHRREITHCYEQRLQRDPNLAGRIEMEWTIAPSGDVVSASVSESTMDDAEVGRCMARRIQQWVFPEPDGGGIVRVNYPWNFSGS